jgi:hypothetical protein
MALKRIDEDRLRQWHKCVHAGSLPPPQLGCLSHCFRADHPSAHLFIQSPLLYGVAAGDGDDRVVGYDYVRGPELSYIRYILYGIRYGSRWPCIIK